MVVDVVSRPADEVMDGHLLRLRRGARQRRQARRRQLRAPGGHRITSGRLHVAVTDDGAGGADPSTGSGLRGLIDRVEALGGTLTVSSKAGVGTRMAAELPLGRHLG